MTRPPVRLLESTDLSPTERGLLESARTVPPVDYDVAAGAARLRASLDALATGVGAGTAAKGAGTLPTLTLTKLALVLVPALSVLGLGIGYYVLHTRDAAAPSVLVNAPAPPIAVIPSAPVVPTQEVAPDERSAPVAAPATISRMKTIVHARESVSSKASGASARSSRASVASAPVAALAAQPVARAPESEAATPIRPEPAAQAEPQPQPNAEAKPEAVEKPNDSIDELQGIARARALLDRQPQAALDLLTRLGREHPHGYFVEERTALTILALEGAGQHEQAQKRGASFLRTHPASPYADRVRKAMGE